MLFAACDCKPLSPDVPTVSYDDIQPREVKEIEDAFQITFRFTDGDGDIRSSEGEVDGFTHIELRDLRPQLADSVAILNYVFPEYDTNTCNPSIQGKITLDVAPTAIFPRNLQEQETRFSFRLRDAAGNWSEPDTTDAILIVR